MKKRLHYLMQFSMEQIETMYARGFVGYHEYWAYVYCWRWANMRSSNIHNASAIQDRFFTQYGREAFYRRINKVRNHFGFKPLEIPA